jgi:hypothetical protein
MKHVLLSFCLTAVAVSAPTTFTRVSYLDGDVAMGMAIPLTHCIPPTVVVPSDQHSVRAVVVDMPERASLAYASPETWGSLPMSDPTYEQSPASTGVQVALN